MEPDVNDVILLDAGPRPQSVAIALQAYWPDVDPVFLREFVTDCPVVVLPGIEGKRAVACLASIAAADGRATIQSWNEKGEAATDREQVSSYVDACNAIGLPDRHIKELAVFLRTALEPEFSSKCALPSGAVRFRFSFKPTFSEPVVINLWGDKGQGQYSVKKLGGRAGYSFCPPVAHVTGVVEPETWTSVKRRISAAFDDPSDAEATDFVTIDGTVVYAERQIGSKCEWRRRHASKGPILQTAFWLYDWLGPLVGVDPKR